MPVPVHHAVCAGSDMAVRLQTELTFIGRPSRESLCLCLKNEVVIPFQTSRHISAEGDLCSGQFILCGVIDICSCNGQTSGSSEMIHIRLNSIGISSPFKIQIMSDKLILSAVFIYDRRLPAQKLLHLKPLELFKLRAQTSVNGSPDVREVLPGVDPVAPVIQTELRIQRIQIIMELIPQILYKFLLNVFPPQFRNILSRYRSESRSHISCVQYVSSAPVSPSRHKRDRLDE